MVVMAGKVPHGDYGLSKPRCREVGGRRVPIGSMRQTEDILFALALTILIFGAVFSIAFMAKMEAFR
jgi:hypothetical protein